MFIFHLAVNVSPRNVIHTALSISLLDNLFYCQNESITYVTPHFSKENEILQFASFHYWHNQNFRENAKRKVVILAEFLKHICERVNFSKVRGLTACNFSNNKYFHRYFSKILLNLIIDKY